jgi:hypothetical protein
MSGCGCKGNQNPPPPPPPPPQNPAPQQNRAVNEDVRASIKKTIEKYYNVNKTQK